MSTELLGDELRRAWAGHVRRMASQPYLLALMLGSLFLSAASFFTTFVGMQSFAPNFFVNFCIVFAIQALLFVTSWRIGFAMADREALPLFTIFVFLICLATSVFFSWVALFGTINTEEEQERNRITRIHRAVEDTNTALADRLVQLQRRQLDAMVDSEPYALWASGVERIGSEALASRDLLAQQRDQAAAAAARRIQALENQRADLLRGDAARTERAEAAERELSRLNDARPELVRRVNRLRGELEVANEAVIVKEGEMEAEERGGAAGQGVGRGPIWRALRDERNILAAERDVKRRLFQAADAELAESDRRIEQLTATVAGARGASSEAEIATIQRRLGEVSAQLEQGGGEPALEADVERMNADLSRFQATFDLAAFDEAAVICAGMLDAMRGNEALATRVAALSCDRTPLAEFLNPIRETNAARARIADRCAPSGAQALTISELSFEQSVAYGRECVALSALSVSAVDDLRSEIDRLVVEEDPNAGTFVKTLNAWAARDKLAYLALAIALFIDLLVLFSGLIGALSGTGALRRMFGWTTAQKVLDDFKRSLAVFDDPREKAREILSLVEPYHGAWRVKGASTAGLIDLTQYEGTDKALVRAFLTERPRLAVPVPEETAAGGGGFGFGRRPAPTPSRDRFIVSTTLTSALRTIVAGEEEIVGASGDSEIANHLPLSERRAAARAVLKLAQPFKPPAKGERGLGGYKGQVSIETLAKELGDGAGLEAARELLFGLYTIKMARPFTTSATAKEVTEPVYYLTRRGRDRLEAERRSGEEDAEGPRIGDPQLAASILDAIEPISGLMKQMRRGPMARRAIGVVDLRSVNAARRDGARKRLNQMHLDGQARRFEQAPPDGEMVGYLLRLGGIEELKSLAADREALQAEAAAAEATAAVAIAAEPAKPRLEGAAITSRRTLPAPAAPAPDRDGRVEPELQGDRRVWGGEDDQDAAFDGREERPDARRRDAAWDSALEAAAGAQLQPRGGPASPEQRDEEDRFAKSFQEDFLSLTARRPEPRPGRGGPPAPRRRREAS